MSITITITIDGGEVSATTVSPQTPSLLTPASGTMDAGVAPSERELSDMVGLSSPSGNVPVARAGDTSAGSAPRERELPTIAGLPIPLVEQNIPLVGVGDIAAGSAPNSPPTEH